MIRKFTVSHDDSIPFPLPGCHRPVAWHLRHGQILITHRFMQGGKGWTGTWTQNFFAALADDESAISATPAGSSSPTAKSIWSTLSWTTPPRGRFAATVSPCRMF